MEHRQSQTIFGLCGIAAPVVFALFGCEFASPVGSIHNLSGLAGFASAVTGVFVSSRIFAADPNWKSYRAYSVLTAALGLTSLLLWIALAKAARIQILNGSLQRVFVGTILLWIGIVGFRLSALSRSA